MKKILGLAITAVVIIAIAAAGTTAFFSDQQKASNNSISAGTLYLTPGGTGPDYTFVTDVTVAPAGSELYNGTGKATGAPITLTGSDTITVTTAGTFYVTLTDGMTGTATSGTGATVAGSPQALVAGRNTVTITGTGNFTVATNLAPTDSFIQLTNSGTLAGYFDVKLTNVHLDTSGFPTNLIHWVDASNILHTVTAGDLGTAGKVSLWLSNTTSSTPSNAIILQPGGTVSAPTSTLTYYKWIGTGGTGYINQAASSVMTLANGTGVADGASTGTAINLSYGSNTITVTTQGTFTVVLPTGATGTATTGTGVTVAGSPQALVAGSNTVSTTGTGTFTVTVNCGTLANGTTGRVGTSPTNLTFGATTNTITTTTSGDFTVTLPQGVTGTATSGTTAVNGSPQALSSGANTVTTTGAVGDFTIVLTYTSISWTDISIPNGTGTPDVSLSAGSPVYLHVTRYLPHVGGSDTTTNNSVQGEKLYSDFIFTLHQVP